MYHYAGNNPVRYTDPDGREDELIKKEKDVEIFLNSVINDSENYKIDMYQRRAMGKGEKTKIKTHTLYLITQEDTGKETTLSFNGTCLWLWSKGAWATDTKMDVDSYKSYKDGKNEYDMNLMLSAEDINVKDTVIAIVNSINSKTKYYALDHQNNEKRRENCNTAAYNTVRLNVPKSVKVMFKYYPNNIHSNKSELYFNQGK